MVRMKVHHQFKTLSWFLFVFLAAKAQLISGVQGQVAPPSRLRYTVIDHDSVQISWKAPKGKIDGYKLLVTPNSGKKQAKTTQKCCIVCTNSFLTVFQTNF
ncbi:hypothetical protein lerEdw1_010721 [Lerista edwardsae]|nr:hypothetical protein lerEdw1_010721 [Lerista edwardsae]